jgi:hypothetical protein
MQGLYGDKVRFRTISRAKPFLRRLGLPGVSDVFGSMEENALWSRFGLQAP